MLKCLNGKTTFCFDIRTVVRLLNVHVAGAAFQNLCVVLLSSDCTSSMEKEKTYLIVRPVRMDNLG